MTASANRRPSLLILSWYTAGKKQQSTTARFLAADRESGKSGKKKKKKKTGKKRNARYARVAYRYVFRFTPRPLHTPRGNNLVGTIAKRWNYLPAAYRIVRLLRTGYIPPLQWFAYNFIKSNGGANPGNPDDVEARTKEFRPAAVDSSRVE